MRYTGLVQYYGVPAVGVAVSLIDGGGSLVWSGLTDISGRFSSADIAAGSFVATVAGDFVGGSYPPMAQEVRGGIESLALIPVPTGSHLSSWLHNDGSIRGYSDYSLLTNFGEWANTAMVAKVANPNTDVWARFVQVEQPTVKNLTTDTEHIDGTLAFPTTIVGQLWGVSKWKSTVTALLGGTTQYLLQWTLPTALDQSIYTQASSVTQTIEEADRGLLTVYNKVYTGMDLRQGSGEVPTYFAGQRYLFAAAASGSEMLGVTNCGEVYARTSLHGWVKALDLPRKPVPAGKTLPPFDFRDSLVDTGIRNQGAIYLRVADIDVPAPGSWHWDIYRYAISEYAITVGFPVGLDGAEAHCYNYGTYTMYEGKAVRVDFYIPFSSESFTTAQVYGVVSYDFTTDTAVVSPLPEDVLGENLAPHPNNYMNRRTPVGSPVVKGSKLFWFATAVEDGMTKTFPMVYDLVTNTHEWLPGIPTMYFPPSEFSSLAVGGRSLQSSTGRAFVQGVRGYAFDGSRDEILEVAGDGSLSCVLANGILRDGDYRPLDYLASGCLASMALF